MTIEETLRLRADGRKKKLKEFNYKFHNNVSKRLMALKRNLLTNV
jgi:cell division protein FtsZ